MGKTSDCTGLRRWCTLDTMENAGKYLVFLGIVLILVGILISSFDRIPLLGKLPGDFHIKRGNVHVYVPLATSLAISLILTILLRLVSKLSGR